MPAPTAVQPPGLLATRIGGSAEGYREIARFHHERIVSLLPPNWSWEGKRVLDFGCGPGRTLSQFATEAHSAEFHGCDIHAESIAWATENLPQFTFFVNREEPPLDRPSSHFDLVYGVSVFTHLTEHWSGWLAEVHRILKPDGVAIFSFLGESMWQAFGLGQSDPWREDETGMLVTGLGNPWDMGGPNVFHSGWWLREHWGRGFEFLELRARDTWNGVEGHGWLVLRRRDGEISPEELERLDPDEPREALALARNLRLLMPEVRRQAEEQAAEISRLQRATETYAAELSRRGGNRLRSLARRAPFARRAIGSAKRVARRARSARPGSR
jgi:SAM-dependent methyltransferase